MLKINNNKKKRLVRVISLKIKIENIWLMYNFFSLDHPNKINLNKLY